MYAKSSDTKADQDLINRVKMDAEMPRNSAIYAYQYFLKLSTQKNPILTKEYKQLPDDSQFIDKHYNDLIKYRDLICGVGGQFSEIPSACELFLRLSEVHPRRISQIESNNNTSANTSTISASTTTKIIDQLLKLQIERFDQLVIDLMNTLKLNGGHLFVLDLLIYNKQVFDHIEHTNHNV
ncbi:hypothetical protein C6P40_001629 [Pichia californica]|uniref:Uncharacterized protein n=1 Tax=Pichia californica TaxID=460514 RepID=A0A9P6WQN1_9ASCO|nr:hypothetical protein C6P42_000026 [[Candida] californica]KAG0691345.1 hypothetical protein C6P40_001629 [[Candida] californica]